MYFLIDFENVHHTGLEGLEYLTDKDTVIIFMELLVKNQEISVAADFRFWL